MVLISMFKRLTNRLWLLALLIAILIPFTALAQTRPPLPYEDVGACPFECCTYREWVAQKRTAIHQSRNPNSPVLFTVAAGQRIQAVTGVVVTTKAGEISIKKPIVLSAYSRNDDKPKPIQARPGDILYLLTYQGEGSYFVWFKGENFSIDVAEVIHQNEESVPPGTSINIPRPTSSWWVKMKNRQGQIGWTNQPENFGNKDACG